MAPATSRRRQQVQPPAGWLQRLGERDLAASTAVFRRLGHTHGRGRRGLKAVERLGQGYLWFGVPIALLIFSRDARLRRDAATWLLAMVTDLLTVAAIKAVVRRPRPPYNVPDMLVISVDQFSFPSGMCRRDPSTRGGQQSDSHRAPGHSSRGVLITCLCFTCAIQTGLSRLAALPVGVWACTTAVSRVAMGRHYVADVLVGCLLGLLEFQAVRRLAPPLCASAAVHHSGTLAALANSLHL